MRFGGVLLALKSELRRRTGALLFAILVVGVAGGATLTAVVGARRSDTAYARFRVWAHAADFTASSSTEDDLEQSKRDIARIERAPFMGEFGHLVGTGASVRKRGGELFFPFQIQVLADRDDLLARGALEREKVLNGRHADPASEREATVGFSTAKRLGVGVGDTIEVVPDGGAPIPVQVVGVVARTTEIPTIASTPKRSVAVTSAFMRAHAELFAADNETVIFRLRPGTTANDAARWFATEMPNAGVFPTAINIPKVDDTIRVETVAWWMVAGVLALTFLVLVGLLLLRNAAAVADDVATMVTMGMTRRRILGLGAVRGFVVGAFGGLLGALIAVVVSPLTPAGLARLIEPAPGIRVDGTVLAFGAVAMIVVSTLFGAGAAWRAHALTRAGAVRRRPVPLPSGNVPLFVGLALLFRPFQRREQALTRITVASFAFVVASIVAVGATLVGLERVQDDSRLVGATWDGYVQVSDPATEAQIGAAVGAVRKMPAVDVVTRGGFVPVPRPRSDELIGVQLFDDPSTLGPAIIAGRVPRTAREVAMGGDEMRKFGVHIGDRFSFQPDPERKPEMLDVVGRSVLVPPLSYEAGPGDGIAATTALAELFGLPRDQAVPFLLVRFKRGVDPDDALEQARQVVNRAANPPDEPRAFAITSHDRTVSDGIQRVGTVPRGLIAFLAILGVVALVQLLLVSTRRRRLHIGVLRALGLTRTQVMSLTAVQSLAVAVVATLVGLPLGLIVGRAAWRWFADTLNVVPVETTSATAIATMLVVIVVAALLAALPVGLRATRSRAADVLRTEG